MITTKKNAIGSEKNGSSSEKSSEKTTVITTKKTTEKIVRLMKSTPYITNKELAEVFGITEDVLQFYFVGRGCNTSGNTFRAYNSGRCPMTAYVILGTFLPLYSRFSMG